MFAPLPPKPQSLEAPRDLSEVALDIRGDLDTLMKDIGRLLYFLPGVSGQMDTHQKALDVPHLMCV